MANIPKIALGAWAWGNDGTFGNNFTAEELKISKKLLTAVFSACGVTKRAGEIRKMLDAAL